MLTKKKKLSKKEIKEDKLVESYYKAYGFFEENKSRIGLYALIAVALAAVIYFYIGSKNETNEKAGLELSRVLSIYDSGSYLEAIEGRQGTNVIGLKRIVEEYGSTENGEYAKIMLANSYFMLGKLEEAFKYYEDYGGDNELYKATALAGEAGYYASKKEYEKAADLYRKASKISEVNAQNPEYILKASINYINAGKKDIAKELLETLKRDFTTSSSAREADRYLAMTE
jgi:tetratricopeptide (TPR) repeat protein